MGAGAHGVCGARLVWGRAPSPVQAAQVLGSGMPVLGWEMFLQEHIYDFDKVFLQEHFSYSNIRTNKYVHR